MKVRVKSLWKVPVFCAFASWIGFYVTVYVGRLFFIVKTVGADGITQVSVDPVRSAIFNAVLFISILLVGGLWAFRSMTKSEVIISSAIASFIYLLIVFAELFVADFPVSLGVSFAYIQTWTGIFSSFLTKLTDNFNLSVVISSFTPLLFVMFGRKAKLNKQEIAYSGRLMLMT